MAELALIVAVVVATGIWLVYSVIHSSCCCGDVDNKCSGDCNQGRNCDCDDKE